MGEKFQLERNFVRHSLLIALHEMVTSALSGGQNVKVVNFQGEYSKRRGYYSSRSGEVNRANNVPEIFILGICSEEFGWTRRCKFYRNIVVDQLSLSYFLSLDFLFSISPATVRAF
jgi:hypothetical protein